jgi:hypothetical protein
VGDRPGERLDRAVSTRECVVVVVGVHAAVVSSGSIVLLRDTSQTRKLAFCRQFTRLREA